ncbi:50S ribosomal protein L11 methyltransferase [Desulfovibrio litoralis]|uniref:Ribosomal protein L11 methyltransferase n=1 Tax=Desulfovibrio litoralis DSM 11393 TaxID=1121455 RepID=A0A1M7T4C4_9BACT|nr:50S ribosomal protein L11 methyltransferase [Desulfovibrio litoralis]SHN65595.1 ribosomal protein L11 methyltransferase [Desulfovibrio litoralis DSM 11393]
MELTRIELTTKTEDVDLLTAYLSAELRCGWEEQELGEISKCVLHFDSKNAAQELIDKITKDMPQIKLEKSTVPQTNWIEAWKEFFTPVICGKHFIVLAPWMEKEKEEATKNGRFAIVIEPKTAFGTGHHATTALCLKAFSRLLEEGKVKTGQRFLDLGTGSGILAIGAASQGLSGLALDIDIMAIENALENAGLNHVESKIEIRRGSLGPKFTTDNPEVGDGEYDGESPVTEEFDLIFANILAEPLKMLSPHIVKQLKKGGILILSGILKTQAEAVAEVYKKEGLNAPEIQTEADWASLLFVK